VIAVSRASNHSAPTPSRQFGSNAPARMVVLSASSNEPVSGVRHGRAVVGLCRRTVSPADENL
jgi:hypothetical protein